MTELPELDPYVPAYSGGGAGEQPSDAETAAGVARYLEALREGLRSLHESGAPGSQVTHAHSDAIDRLMRRLGTLAESRYYAGGGDLEGRISIVAVGGYARREMCIHSDVDLLFLYRGELTPLASNVAERLQYWLWDAGVQVGGAVRNLTDTLGLAVEDMTVGTAILDARFLGGDADLFHALIEGVTADLLSDPAGFIERQRVALEERHLKFGESLYLLQPNVKEGAGGLRDYHAAYWAARAASPSVRGFQDLLHVGLLSENETRALGAALDFLWRIRNALHLQAGRKSDQMSFENQEIVAEALGYGDESGRLPVEGFMRDYYRHARTIRTLSDIVLEQCRRRTTPKGPTPQPVQTEDGFRVVGERLEIPHQALLRQRPVRLLTAFQEAQKHRVRLSRTARRLVAENLDLIDDEFRSSPEATAAFLGILDSEWRVMRTLMELNETGLLASYLPEWDHIVCLWQHVVYHTYTVDVHSIFLVEELRRLWKGDYEDEHPVLTEMVRGVADRPALFLGALLHDIGKGRGGDHSARGVVLARKCLLRLGLSEERVERAVFLVAQHLLMSKLAQRRDLSDPRVIVDFARVLKDRESLRNLYLVTFADIRASSKSAWNEWRGQLLHELYERTAEFLESGRDDPQRALELIDARVEARREGARVELRKRGVADEEIDAFFETMPRRYFIAHMPRQIARHAAVMLAFRPEQVMATAVREMRGGFSELILVTRDVHGLYASIAGSLTAADINILGSHVYTTRSGLALEVYRVGTPEGGAEERRMAWEQFGKIATSVLKGERRLAELLAGRRRVGRRALRSRKPPKVAITNEESDFYTIVDVTANDRLGLLYALVGTIADHGFEIFLSKATTVLDQVADSFYLKGSDLKKITNAGALAALQRDLEEVVRESDA